MDSRRRIDFGDRQKDAEEDGGIVAASTSPNSAFAAYYRICATKLFITFIVFRSSNADLSRKMYRRFRSKRFGRSSVEPKFSGFFEERLTFKDEEQPHATMQS